MIFTRRDFFKLSSLSTFLSSLPLAGKPVRKADTPPGQAVEISTIVFTVPMLVPPEPLRQSPYSLFMPYVTR